MSEAGPTYLEAAIAVAKAELAKADALEEQALNLLDAAWTRRARATRLLDALLGALAATLHDPPDTRGAALLARPEPPADATPTAGDLAWLEYDSGRWAASPDGAAWLAAHPTCPQDQPSPPSLP